MVKKIICIVQARMNSKRLPGKVLKKITRNENVLEFLINRLSQSKKIDQLVIACSKNKKDDKLVKFLKKKELIYFRGDEKNVLKRFYLSAKQHDPDIIIRITSDCPFTDPKLVDKFLKIFIKKRYDYYGNINPRSFPDGFDIEIFNFKTLSRTFKSTKNRYDLEHVTPFMINSRKFKKGNFSLKDNFSKMRVTLDNKNDLKLIRYLAKDTNSKRYFSWRSILNKIKLMNKKLVKFA